jgi:hypothetical protein
VWSSDDVLFLGVVVVGCCPANDIQLSNHLALASAVLFHVAFFATGVTSELLLVAFVVRKLRLSGSLVEVVEVHRFRSVSPVLSRDLGRVASLTSLVRVRASKVWLRSVACILGCAIPGV